MMRILSLLLISCSLTLGSTIYSITDLGSLGGSSSTGYQMNDAGTVVGWAETVTGSDQAFVSLGGGSLQTLPSPGLRIPTLLGSTAPM